MKDKWDDIGTRAWEAVFSKVKELREPDAHGKQMSLDKIAQMIGAGNRSTISGWLNKDRGGKDVAFPDMLRYLTNLGFDLSEFIPVATMRRMGALSPVETVEGSGLIPIPVFESAGAGPAVDFFSNEEPERIIYVLPRYLHSNICAIEVTGDSMEPTIKRGAFVGVVPISRELEEGHVYLVRRPNMGLMVKRVIVDKDGTFFLRSDNGKYPDQILPAEGYEDIIVGKILWVWQEV